MQTATFPADAKRVLVSKHGAVGDVIQADGALRDSHLRVHSAPGEGCRIVVEAPPWEGGGS